MDAAYTYFADLAKEVTPPPDGILSRVLFQSEKLKVVIFGFAAGHEMSEHSSSSPAVMHFLSGEATVSLRQDVKQVGSGTWMHMAANLPHAIRANTPVVMLLLLLQ